MERCRTISACTGPKPSWSSAAYYRARAPWAGLAWRGFHTAGGAITGRARRDEVADSRVEMAATDLRAAKRGGEDFARLEG